MIKSFSLLFIFAIIFSKADYQSLGTLISDAPTFNSNIIISIDDVFFYIVDSAEKNPQYYRMMLSLSSSEIIFVGPKENDFRGFTCEPSYCSRSSNEELDISTPRLLFNGYRVQVSGFLDKDSWFFKQSDKYKPILATSIKNGSFGYYPFSDFAGVLGLGRAQNGRHFPNIFAIEQNAQIGNTSIIFEPDLKHLKSKKPVVSWHADENWHIGGVQLIRIGHSAIYSPVDHKIIFDLNADDIVFPEYFKDKILNVFTLAGLQYEILGSYINFKVEDDNINFPDIEIEANGTKLILPPKFYISKSATRNQAITIIRFSSSQNSYDYITPEFQHYIILGKFIIQYYYIVFDGLEEKIFLYKQEIADKDPTNNSISILRNIIIMVIVVLIFCFLRRKCKRKAIEDYDEFMEN